ncbi:hypothetical protein GCM10027168_69970 [Streptomyces capparidis]
MSRSLGVRMLLHQTPSRTVTSCPSPARWLFQTFTCPWGEAYVPFPVPEPPQHLHAPLEGVGAARAALPAARPPRLRHRLAVRQRVGYPARAFTPPNARAPPDSLSSEGRI